MMVEVYTELNAMSKSADLAGVEIADLRERTGADREGAARILYESFRSNWPHAWPTMDSAREEVAECLADGRICLAAFDTDGSIIGWIGAISNYDGNVYELHPLCVDQAHRRKGIGAALVRSLEGVVAAAGGITIYLGTDDEANQTSLGSVDIYDRIWYRIENIRNLKGHPYSFYERLGFKIVGVVPDANGFGKPDIMMAKRVAAYPQVS